MDLEMFSVVGSYLNSDGKKDGLQTYNRLPFSPLNHLYNKKNMK